MDKIRILFISIYLAGCYTVNSQEVFKTTSAKVDFFSSAPVEDIRASTNRGVSVLIPSTGEISFLVNIKDLNFPKALMQEHFNENYMESDRYPTATFKGKIVEPVDLSSKGEKQVVLAGILMIHGIKKEREIPALLVNEGDQLILKSNFDVACEDHKIKIPKILWKNIAEVVQVQVNANYKH